MDASLRKDKQRRFSQFQAISANKETLYKLFVVKKFVIKISKSEQIDAIPRKSTLYLRLSAFLLIASCISSLTVFQNSIIPRLKDIGESLALSIRVSIFKLLRIPVGDNPDKHNPIESTRQTIVMIFSDWQE